MEKAFFFYLLVTSTFLASAQLKPRPNSHVKLPLKTALAYVGEINGFSAKKYKKKRPIYRYRDDSLFKIKDLTKSKFPIEIRLYENTDLYIDHYTIYCTILFLDTTWKVVRKKYHHRKQEDSLNTRLIEQHTIDKINPDSAFKELVKNNIFSLTTNPKTKIQHGILTPEGVEENKDFFACPHCRSYLIETKIDSFYNIVYIGSENDAMAELFPYDALSNRKKNIVNQLKTSAIMVRKSSIN